MTASEKTEIQFGKWIKKFPLPHCSVLSKAEVMEIVNSNLDKPVVRISTKGDAQILLTGTSLVIDQAIIPFNRIDASYWIDPDHREKARNKEKHFDRIIIVADSENIKVEGLGQAVFPLMKVLEWTIKERTSAASHFRKDPLQSAAQKAMGIRLAVVDSARQGKR